MEDQPQHVTTEKEAWDHLQNLIKLAAASPSRARHVAVGEAAVEWARLSSSSPRDVTSHSALDRLVDKESIGEMIARDHLGRRLELGVDGATTVQATPDESLAVDGLDQE